MKFIFCISLILLHGSLSLEIALANDTLSTNGNFNITVVKTLKPTTVPILIAGAATSSIDSNSISVPSFDVWYQSTTNADDVYCLKVIFNPRDKIGYVVAGGEDFYILENLKLSSFRVDADGGMWCVTNYYRTTKPVNNLNEVWSEFAANVTTDDLNKKDDGAFWFDLRKGVRYEFFTANSAGGSNSGKVTLKNVELTDHVLKLNILSDKEVYHGTFWIDLGLKKVVKSKVD